MLRVVKAGVGVHYYRSFGRTAETTATPAAASVSATKSAAAAAASRSVFRPSGTAASECGSRPSRPPRTHGGADDARGRGRRAAGATVGRVLWSGHHGISRTVSVSGDYGVLIFDDGFCCGWWFGWCDTVCWVSRASRSRGPCGENDGTRLYQSLETGFLAVK